MVGSVEERIAAQHPIRRIKVLADRALGKMGPVFDAMYAETGRPSVPPERLLKAQLLIALFLGAVAIGNSASSSTTTCCFAGFWILSSMSQSFDASTFSRNRERLIRREVAEQFLAAVVEEAKKAHLLSSLDHFSIDGTFIESLASMKSFRPKDGPPGGDSNGSSDFRGEQRRNETHASVTDPESRLARKGPGQRGEACLTRVTC